VTTSYIQNIGRANRILQDESVDEGMERLCVRQKSMACYQEGEKPLSRLYAQQLAPSNA
jgi:hypothetical protein